MHSSYFIIRGLGIKSWQLFFPLHYMMIPINKECVPASMALVDNVVEGSELCYYNTEGNRNSVVSQASCRMDVTRLEQCAYSRLWML